MKPNNEFIEIGIPGFNELLKDKISKGISILVSGGCGTGKTIFCLQSIYHELKRGKKCIYVSFEETQKSLKRNAKKFGWDLEKYEKSKQLVINQIRPFKISKKIEGMLAAARGEISVDIKDISGLALKDFKPDYIIIDSLSALSATFVRNPENYRLYLEELVNYLQKIGVTSFFVSETEQDPTVFSRSGVEEFLVDGVIVLYNIRKGQLRRRALEILKMRGIEHEQKIVPFRIEHGKGIIVHSTTETLDI